MNILARWDSGVRAVRQGRYAFQPRALVRFLVAVGLMAGAGLGAMLTLKGSGTDIRNTPAIEGTWELSALSGKPVRAESASGVVWQRVSFREGKVRGETRVQSSPSAGSVNLPFPNESVDRVISAPDDSSLRVLWSGTYEIDAHSQVTLHIGKAVYFVKFVTQAGKLAIEFNQDVILTLPGTAGYRRAVASPAPLPQDNLELFPTAVR